MSGLKLNPALKYTLAQNIFHFSQNVVSYRNETSPEEKCNIFGKLSPSVHFPRKMEIIRITKKT